MLHQFQVLNTVLLFKTVLVYHSLTISLLKTKQNLVLELLGQIQKC